MVSRHLIIIASLLATTACANQQMAELVDRSGNYYGRNNWTQNGTPVARFSDDNRASQDQAIAYKYQSTTHQYGVDAAVDKIEANTLAEPSAPAAQQAAAPFGQHSAPLEQEAPAAKAQPSTGPAMFRWPTEGKIISRFGPKTDGLSNDGINIAAGKGDPIWAAADGEVAYVGKDLEGYGNLLILRHKDGWMSSYAHAEEFLLKQGDVVAQGDVLGYVGNTGSVRSPQLHFSLREGKIPIDPEAVLGRNVAASAY